MDKIDEMLVDMIRERPRRQADLCHASPMTPHATVCRLQKLQIDRVIYAERGIPHEHSTVYHIVSTEENENKKENEARQASPIGSNNDNNKYD